MEILMQIFAPMIVFVYHCFDRIVINGYMLSRSNHKPQTDGSVSMNKPGSLPLNGKAQNKQPKLGKRR